MINRSLRDYAGYNIKRKRGITIKPFPMSLDSCKSEISTMLQCSDILVHTPMSQCDEFMGMFISSNLINFQYVSSKTRIDHSKEGSYDGEMNLTLSCKFCQQISAALSFAGKSSLLMKLLAK